MRTKRRKLKWLKWLSAITLSLILIIILAQAFAAFYGDDLLARYLSEWERKSGGRYHLQYDKVAVNLLKNRLKVTGFHIRPVTAALVERENGRPGYKRLMDIHIPFFTVEGVDVLKLLLKRELNIDSITLGNGKIKILVGEGKEPAGAGQTGKVKNFNFPALKAFRVDSLVFDNCSFQVVRSAPGTSPSPEADFSFFLKDLNIRFLRVPSGKDAVSPFNWNQIVLTVRDLNWLPPDRMYRLKCERLTLDGEKSRLHIGRIEWQPLYRKYQFSRLRGYQTDRVQLLIRELNLTGIELPQASTKRRICCSLMEIEEPRLLIFRDRRLPRKSNPSPKKLPQQLLKDLNLHLDIAAVHINNGHITYEEHPLDADTPGKIFFDRLEGHIKNITNDKKLLNRKIDLSLALSTRFMGKSAFEIRLKMPLNHRYNYFTFNGALDKVLLTDLNPVFKSLAQLKIDRGVLDRLTFFGMGNEDYAEGSVRLYYHDLKVSVLEKKIPHRKRKIRSFILNRLIRNQNPREDRILKVGKMYWRRKKFQSFVNYLWKTLITGLKSSIGLKK